MQLDHIVIGLSLLLPGNLLGQAHVDIEQPMPAVFIRTAPFDRSPSYTNATEMLVAYFGGEGQSNINIIVNTPQSCPLEYTNLISNSTLFNAEEQMLLRDLPSKYEHVTTNSPPRGSVFAGLDRSANTFFMEGYTVGRFRSINKESEVKVFFASMIGGKAVAASYRNAAGDGYEVLFNHDVIAGVRQFRHGQLNGLWADFEGGHCTVWMHFVNGKAIGKWLVWNRTGSLYMAAAFKQPYDFVGHLRFTP